MPPNTPPPAAHRVRLNDRDRRALTLVARLQVVTLDDLAVLLAYLGGKPGALGTRTTRDIVNRWQAVGLAATDHNPRGGRALVRATRSGAAWTDVPTPQPVAWRDLPHTLTVAAVACGLIAGNGVTWTSESELRAAGPADHRPDGVAALADGQRIAIEVERHNKTRARWADIIGHNLRTYTGTAYYALPQTAAALGAWAAENLTQDDRTRFFVQDLGEWAR